MSALLASLVSDECCDVVEIQDDAVILCTYELDIATQIKRGSLRLIAVRRHTESLELAAIAQEATPAIFDAKWRHRPPAADSFRRQLAVGAADGSLSVYECPPSSGFSRVAAWAPDGDLLPPPVLSVDWAGSAEHLPSTLLASRGDGSIVRCSFAEAAILLEHSWSAHTLAGSPIEAWYVSCSPWDEHIAWSGGDDSRLKGWDTRSQSTSPTFNSTCHSAGVCSISWNPHQPHVIASGSYDESILLWDDRQTSKPICSYAAGGGVWRMRWHPHADHSELLLAACMHGGASVIQFQQHDADPTVWSARLASHFSGHTSMAYGADWLQQQGDDSLACLTCSFYDKLLCLWDPGKQSIDGR